jgi:hypothetical protein
MADAAPFPPDQIPPYENPEITEKDVDGLAVLEAEVRDIYEGGTKRSHLRIIGAPHTVIAGRALVYADTYSRSPEDETYSYARHDMDQIRLLERLEEFLATALIVEFEELRNRPAVGVMQTRDEMREFEAPTYLNAVTAMKAQPLVFARLNFPFGDITMEFQERPDIAESEFRMLAERKLQREIDRPVFAFDATRSDIWTAFLTTIHWAREMVPPEVLRQVLRMACRVAA